MPEQRDTSVEARSLQVAAIKAMAPARRVEVAIEMSELAARISAAGAAHRSSSSAT